MDSPLTFFHFLLKKFPLDTPPPRPHVFGKFFIPLVIRDLFYSKFYRTSVSEKRLQLYHRKKKYIPKIRRKKVEKDKGH